MNKLLCFKTNIQKYINVNRSWVFVTYNHYKTIL